jgi:hypothetical protein
MRASERFKDAHSILKALRDLYKDQKETLGQAQTELDVCPAREWHLGSRGQSRTDIQSLIPHQC